MLAQASYIENFHSNEYKNYLDIIKTIFDYKIKIINDNSSSDKGYFFNENKDQIHLKYKKFEAKITKPVYKNIEDELVKLKNEKKELMLSYENLKYNIIHELNLEEDFKKYDKIVNKLIKIDKQIQNLVDYYKKVNLSNLTDKDENKAKIEEINNSIINLNEKFKNDVFKDDIEKKRAIDIYKKNIQEKKILENIFFNEINYIIMEKPNIEYITGSKKQKKEKVEKPKKSKVIPKGNVEQVKRYKLKEKIKEKNAKSKISVEERVTKLEKKIKEKFFKEFKFKNEEECASGSYSADFFVKKPQLLKIIKKYPEIKNILPKDYPKLPKDKICKELYKL